MKGRKSESHTMICTSQHQDPIILLQPVNFVEKIASGRGRHKTIDIFEDEETGRRLAGFLEDATDAEFGVVAGERFDIKASDGGRRGAVGEFLHDGTDADGFTVARRTVEDDSALG